MADASQSDGSQADQATRRRAEALAHLLDSSVRIPGTRFRVGVDPLLGLAPGVGDVASAALSGYIVYAGAKLGVPRATLVRMALNVLVDAVVGAVPVVGDAFDAAWKANRRNVELLQTRADDPSGGRRDRRVVAGVVAAFVLLLLAIAAAVGLAAAWLLSQLGGA